MVCPPWFPPPHSGGISVSCGKEVFTGFPEKSIILCRKEVGSIAFYIIVTLIMHSFIAC